MELTLLVIRSAIPEQLAAFYTSLGLHFDHHQHGNGPFHYSAHIGPTVLEIYPLVKNQDKADTNLRLGLAMREFDARISHLKEVGVTFHQAPTSTEWGMMAVVLDPEGRKVELTPKKM